MKKDITVTLEEDLIKEIDSMVDGDLWKNRSQLIEKILEMNWYLVYPQMMLDYGIQIQANLKKAMEDSEK